VKEKSESRDAEADRKEGGREDCERVHLSLAGQEGREVAAVRI